LAPSGFTKLLNELGRLIAARGTESAARTVALIADALAGDRPTKVSVRAQESRDFEKVSAEEVGSILADATTPRTVLEQLLHQRFGASLASATRFSRRDLVNRISEALRDEAGHAAIARLAAHESTTQTVLRPRPTSVFDPEKIKQVLQALRPSAEAGLSVYALSRGWSGLVRKLRDVLPEEDLEIVSQGRRDVTEADWAILQQVATALGPILGE
jgi:hypothetical protein